MLFKKKAAVLIIALTLALALIAPTASVNAYTPPAQAGEIIQADGVKYMVLWRGEGNRSVLIYDYPDVNVKTLTIPKTVNDGLYEWKVIGALSGAFKNCTTPKTIEIPKDTNINWYYMCPDAFINGAKQ